MLLLLSLQIARDICQIRSVDEANKQEEKEIRRVDFLPLRWKLYSIL